MTKYRVYIKTAWAESFEAETEEEAKSKAVMLWKKDYQNDSHDFLMGSLIIETREAE